MDLIIATWNRTKYRHIRECLKYLAPELDVRSPCSFSPPLHPPELPIGISQEEAAQIKALYTTDLPEKFKPNFRFNSLVTKALSFI
jgi:hypothetical protein